MYVSMLFSVFLLTTICLFHMLFVKICLYYVSLFIYITDYFIWTTYKDGIFFLIQHCWSAGRKCFMALISPLCIFKVQ